MNCPDCGHAFDIEKYDAGDIMTCSACGCEVELVSKDPFEYRVIEEEK